MRYLFVSGMFRSGTTLLGRVLNAHKDINIASDPFLPFFKFLRSEISASLGQNVNASMTLADYYFSAEQRNLFKAIQNADLNYTFDPAKRTVLFEAIRAYGTPFSPLLMPHLEKAQGKTYKELFSSFMELVSDVYGQSGEQYTGIKEVWADEFIPALARTYPDEMKFIQIVRDPRAVCSSKNTTEQAYPWLFMGRQWRKLAGLASFYKEDKQLQERVLLVHYESLVSDAEAECRKICDFLGLAYDEAMVNAGSFKDGAGKQWTQNTSYGEGAKAFNAKAIDKWKEKLSAKEIAMIEFLCRPEMELHGYKAENKSIDRSVIEEPPVLDDAHIANWIKPLYSNDIEFIKCEMLKEDKRIRMLYDTDNDLDDVEIENAFLDKSLFNLIKANKQD